MARQQGSLKLGSNIEPRIDAPLDARQVVATEADLTSADTFPYHYVGMIVAARDTGAAYILQGEDPTQAAAWARVGSGGGTYETIKLSDIDKLFINTP